MAVPGRALPRRVAAAALVYWTMAPASLGVVLAQTAAAKLPRVGVLYLSEPFPDPARRRGFALGMHEHGYVDGRNIVFVWRDAQGRTGRLDVLADELVRANVDVIVVGGPGPLAAARRVAASTPIERPTKLDLAIDLQVARELGVTLPRSLLLRADRIAA